jgi:lipoprotein-anchoring transpeptidase ErfK/SrfK
VEYQWLYLVGLAFVGLSLTVSSFTHPIKETTPCANPGHCQSLPQLEVDNGALGIFENQQVAAPVINLAEIPSPTNVLGETSATGEKHIYVNLATQTLSVYQGDTLFMQTRVSTGKWNKTPPGDYTIWVKLRATRMSGGEGADAYDLPNVPYVMFFANDHVPKISGFSLHGAYWHDNFGHPMSHGCVNMRQINAEKLYNWVGPETNGNIAYQDFRSTSTNNINLIQ